MVILIIVTILCAVGLITLKYNVEGESNLPFELSKITVISTIEGNDNEDANNKWNLTVNQNNDIYLYIKKNENYKTTEAIQSITLNNFNQEQTAKIGERKIYKPDANIESVIFKNTEENSTEKIEYNGALDSSIKELKISNQGGLVVFRYALDNIANYVSNDDAEINHDELLKKLNINNDDLKEKISFDVILKLESGKTFKSNIKLELPIDNVVENGTQSKEYTDLKEIVLELGSQMIKLAGIGENIEDNKEKMLKQIENGFAYKKFKEMVKNQGGDISYLENTNKLICLNNKDKKWSVQDRIYDTEGIYSSVTASNFRSNIAERKMFNSFNRKNKKR